jgi:hypothetical protein
MSVASRSYSAAPGTDVSYTLSERSIQGALRVFARDSDRSRRRLHLITGERIQACDTYPNGLRIALGSASSTGWLDRLLRRGDVHASR